MVEAKNEIHSKSPFVKWGAHFLQVLFRGMLILLPIVVVLFVVYLILELVLSVLAPISSVLSSLFGSPPWLMHLISILLLVGIFFSLGIAVRNSKRRAFLQNFEANYLGRIPLYNTVREAVNQFTNLKEVPFSQVVLVDTFGTGVWMTGFVTERIDEDLYTIFVPTAPNPTNGNIYHVPRARLRFLDIKAETAMRTIVGMGTGSSSLVKKRDCEQVIKQPEEEGPAEMHIPQLKKVE